MDTLGSEPMTSPDRVNRRSFFERMAGGFYGSALTYLLSEDVLGLSGRAAAEAVTGHPARRSVYDLKPRTPPFPGKAKAVIHLFMNGGPSQMDLFDPKPLLDRYHGKPY